MLKNKSDKRRLVLKIINLLNLKDKEIKKLTEKLIKVLKFINMKI